MADAAKPARNPNIEVFRVFTMFAIVLYHSYYHGIFHGEPADFLGVVFAFAFSGMAWKGLRVPRAVDVRRVSSTRYDAVRIRSIPHSRNLDAGKHKPASGNHNLDCGSMDFYRGSDGRSYATPGVSGDQADFPPETWRGSNRRARGKALRRMKRASPRFGGRT